MMRKVEGRRYLTFFNKLESDTLSVSNILEAESLSHIHKDDAKNTH